MKQSTWKTSKSWIKKAKCFNLLKIQRNWCQFNKLSFKLPLIRLVSLILPLNWNAPNLKSTCVQIYVDITTTRTEFLSKNSMPVTTNNNQIFYHTADVFILTKAHLYNTMHRTHHVIDLCVWSWYDWNGNKVLSSQIKKYASIVAIQ